MKWKITILSFLLARMSTFCWTTTLRSTSRSRPTQIPRRPIAKAMRLTRLGWTSGPLTGTMRLTRLGWTSGPLIGAMRLMRLGWISGLVTGTATFRMWTWASGLTLRINAGIPMAGAIRLAWKTYCWSDETWRDFWRAGFNYFSNGQSEFYFSLYFLTGGESFS